MIKAWTDDAWNDYLWWLENDKKTLKRINKLIRDIERDPFDGLGKPEPLRYVAEGTWSRRITQEDRLVYSVKGDYLFIYSAKDHCN